MKKMIILAIPLLFTLIAFHPNNDVVITGKITDDSGLPIVGATVMEKGTKTGTVTNASGSFKLTITSNRCILVISAIGYETKEITANGQQSVTIALVSANQKLQEVVVTAYGMRRRKGQEPYSNSYTTSPGFLTQNNGYNWGNGSIDVDDDDTTVGKK